MFFRYKSSMLPADMQEWIKALIRHKLSLDYDSTMVDEEYLSQPYTLEITPDDGAWFVQIKELHD